MTEKKKTSSAISSKNTLVTFNDPVPEEVYIWLNGLITPDENIRMSVSTDITLDNYYRSAWLIATDRELIAFSPKNQGPPKIIRVPLSEIIRVEVQGLFFSGTLKVQTAKFGTTLAHFTRSLISKFSKIPEQIEMLVSEARPGGKIEEVVFKKIGNRRVKRCAQCGKPLHWPSAPCVNCLNKFYLAGRIFSFIRPFWGLAVGVVFLLIIATSISLVSPLIMRTLIDDVLVPSVSSTQSHSDGILPFANQKTREREGTIQIPGKKDNSGKLAFLVILLLLVNVSRNGLHALRTYLVSILGRRISLNARHKVYRHMHSISLQYYHERTTGGVVNTVLKNVEQFHSFFNSIFQEGIVSILTLLIICTILFSINYRLAIIVLLPIPLIVIATIYVGRRVEDIHTILAEKLAGMTSLLVDVISGIRVVKAFAQEKREIKRFERKNWDLFIKELKTVRIQSVFAPLMTFLVSLGTLMIWWVGGHQVIRGSLTLGEFVAFTSYMWQFYGPLESLCGFNHELRKGIGYIKRVFDTLDFPVEKGEKDSTLPGVPRIHGRVEFLNVTFAYEPGKPVLKNLNFVVEPGEMIGIAGHSGAGKTTLIHLICRFYEAQEGSILIDGMDILDVNPISLRKHFGVVLQDSFLFNSSVAENIAYANPKVSLDDIIDVAKMANAHDFILKLPDGYDTLTGERGARLSGGERQRIAIARAILREPDILFLDEATSSLDTETEAKIQEALERLVKGRTTFAIAHRLSTLKNADRLLILNQGELAEFGTHDELIAKDGIFARLCLMQTELNKVRAW